jgi:putative membrane protein
MTDDARRAQPCAPRAGLSRVTRVCVVLVLAGLALAAREPRYPSAFRLEVLPFFAVLPFLARLLLRRALSDRAWVQVTVFLLLHLYGAHSTYANTPIGFELQRALALSRNHYDRVVHFAFGVLMVRPLSELLPQATLGRSLLVAFAFVGAMSVAYEQLEWMTAVLSDPNAGVAFLGAQGDVWDAQKDVTCATIGSLLGLVVEAAKHRTRSGGARRGRSASAA